MILALLLASCLVLVVAAFVLGQAWGRGTGWVVSAGFGGVLTALTWAVAGGPNQQFAWPWLPSLGVVFRLQLDGLGLLFAAVVLGIGALVMAYAVNYLPPGRHGQFYALLTFFAFAMFGLVLAGDVVVMWVMWEFTTLCSFLLISQSGPKGKDPAIRTLLVTAAGGLCLLAAVAVMTVVTGTSRLDDILTSPYWAAHPDMTATLAVLIAAAAFTKCAQFPFHAWLPDAMVASTPVSAYLHAAAMVKAGIFLLIRFSAIFSTTGVWNVLLVGVGLWTALMGAFMALRRHDLKELLAYSTISQLGFMVATIGIGTGYAIVGALAHVVGHALFKSALFMAVGLIDHETRTRDIRKLSGLWRAMPATSVVLVVAAASMAGIPPLFGFVTKEALFKAMTLAPWGSGWTWVICLAGVAAATLTFAYSARMVVTTLPGPPMTPEPHEAPMAMVAPVAVAAGAGVVLGVAGPLAEPLVIGAAAAVTGKPPTLDLSLWHGFTVPLGMSTAVLALGLVLVLARRRVDAVLGFERMSFSAVRVVEGFRSGSIGLGRHVGAPTRSDSPFRHLAAVLGAFVAVVAAGLWFTGFAPLDPNADRAVDWLFSAIVALGAIITIRARSRIALVLSVGVVGFAVALLFFSLGAPDVALTQLLVEILTVVVMVLLLTRLPVWFHATKPPRTIAATAIATLVGLAGFGVGWIMMDSQGLSPVGRYYIEQAYRLTGGTNVVNTILVDFRALDTLGELIVLGVAGVAVIVALESRGLLPWRKSPIVLTPGNPARDPGDNATSLRVTARFVVPLLALTSVWMFLRGHYNPGGGFIAALIGGAALSLVFLAARDDRVAKLEVSSTRLIGGGMLISLITGVFGFAAGSFLRPLGVDVLGIKVSTGLLFDVGVYLAVIGLILTTLKRLGLDTPELAPRRKPVEMAPKEERK